jgi:putative ABC transport system permease protein
MELRPILSALIRNKTGPVLVALQVALSLGILSNALQIVNDRNAVAARPSGLADETSTFSVRIRNLTNDGPEQLLATMKAEADKLRAIPGVVAVADTIQMPMCCGGYSTGVATDRKQQNPTTSAGMFFSGDSLVKAFGLKLTEGRDFLPGELADIADLASDEAPRAVIVTRSLADKMWGPGPAVGKTLYIGTRDEARGVPVVGVVEHLQGPWAFVGERNEHSVLTPQRIYGGPGQQFVVRTEPGQRDRVIKEAENVLRASSATPMILKFRTSEEDRIERYRGDKALSWMLVTVSVLLLVVTCSGIVGMASLWVTQRRKQIGVRRALGARRIDILRYFITENFMITSAGVFGGVLFALGLNQLLVSKLEMARLPGGYLAAGACVFWALGVAAVYGPAWRAASISPATATRTA